ncbi:porin, partial [Candidatus Raskinella chloraquaticus]
MKMVRCFLLGTAALVAGSYTAQAADLAAAEPVEYVKICDAYGAGYFFIPGSADTCLRISGYVRSFVAYQGRNQSNSSTQIDSAATSTINPVIVNAGGILGAAGIVANVPGVTAVGANTSNNLNLVSYGNYGAVGNDIALQAAAGGNAAATARLNGLGANYVLFANAETSDQYVSGIRALLRFDARTKTEWGVLRSFFEFAAATSNAARNGTGVQVRFGFVQFGPITAGVTESFFNTTSTNLFLSAFGDQTRRVPTLAYTAALGNGVSVTLAADDSSIAFAALPIGSTTTGLLVNAGNWVRRAVQLPDAVANVRVAQSWGTAQISGAVGQ